jgi:quercetin dioxygenase-like cupin family protein
METGKLFNLTTDIDYSKDAVVSRTIVKKTTGTITLFAFDQGQGLSPHVAPFDAMVQILDGECSFSIEETPYVMVAGDCLILPAGKIHAVEAIKQFKMLLTMIKIVGNSMRMAD